MKFRSWNHDGERISPDFIGRDGLGYWKEDSIQTSGPVELFIDSKDMDGTEIYEGDILKVGQWIPGDEEEPGIWLDATDHVVKWFGDKGYPAFDLSPGWGGECNAIAEVTQGDFLSMKIIGNIHQGVIK